MKGWIIGGVAAAALVLGACGGDDEKTSSASIDLNPSSTVPATVAETTSTSKAVVNAAAIADKISGAGLGCSDRTPATPTSVAGYPAQSELLKCTISGRKASIAIYASDADVETYFKATQDSLCKQIGKTAIEKIGVAYGTRFTVGTDNSDPALAAQIATATGGQVKRFTC